MAKKLNVIFVTKDIGRHLMIVKQAIILNVAIVNQNGILIKQQ
jgi:hypothetical protein